MSFATCTHCGEAAVSSTGICSCCGVPNYRRIDPFSLALAISGLALYIPLSFVVRIVTFFFGWGVIGIVILVLSYVIPLSISTDGIFIAIKRRREKKTTLALVLGIIGTGIGLLLLSRFAIIRLF